MMKNYSKFHLLSKQTVFYKLICFVVFCSCVFYTLDVFAQKNKQIVIRGKVVNPKGEVLPNVLVDVKETLSFVLTDKEGCFTIAVPNEESCLIFTLDEYERTTVQVGKSRNM